MKIFSLNSNMKKLYPKLRNIPDLELPKIIQKLLDKPFHMFQGCLIITKNHPDLEFFNNDKTYFEGSINHMHISPYLGPNEKRIEKKLILPMGYQYSKLLLQKLKREYSSLKTMVLLSYDLEECDCIVTFHIKRKEGPCWAGDLETYKGFAIMILE